MSSRMKKMRPKGSWNIDERKLAVIAMVMVISVALALGVVFFARGSSSEGKDSTMRAQAEGTTPAATSSAASTIPTVEELEVPAISIYRERNIFEPLIDMANELGVSYEQTTEGTGVAASQGGTPVPTATPSNLPSYRTIPPPLDPDGSRGQVTSVVVVLEGVFEQDGIKFAQIRIGDQLYGKIAVGEIFGGCYKLVNINPGEVATILYGDEKITLGVGQSIYW